jgi:broad specificity phosphatase PhoE
MVLIAVRHGETEWNVQRREMGQLDSPLTVRGIQQAEALGRRLSGIKFDELYSSDLGRAVQTAEIIAATCEKLVRLDSGLRERNMGLFQGLTWKEMSEKYPSEHETYKRTGFYNAIPGGEPSPTERSERGNRASAPGSSACYCLIGCVIPIIPSPSDRLIV